MMFPDPFGPISREEMRQWQLERLQTTLNRAYFQVDFYRKRMDALGLLPEDVAALEDLRTLPFTARRDLADHYPYGLFAVPLRSIVRLHTSTSTFQGKENPIVLGFTRHDVEMWRSLAVRLFEQVEVTDRDIVQVAFNYSLFPGAFTFNQAVEALGATLAPAATNSATIQLQVLQDFRCTVLATTAAFALHIADTMERTGTESSRLRLRLLLVGPEPLPDPARARIESVLGVPVYGLYGVTEMVEPGLAGECTARDGLHLAEDQFLAEVVHPVTGEPLPAGSEGELVLTTLTAEGYPLIRYRTGDVTVLREVPCPCGRKTARLSPVLRRTDNRVSVRGIPFYPEDIELLLRRFDSGLEDFRLVISTVYGIGDQIEVLLTRTPAQDLPGGGRSQYLDLLRSQLRRALGLGVRVQMVEPDQLPREGLGYRTVFRSLTPVPDSPLPSPP